MSAMVPGAGRVSGDGACVAGGGRTTAGAGARVVFGVAVGPAAALGTVAGDDSVGGAGVGVVVGTGSGVDTTTGVGIGVGWG